jgi:outer membrane lipoprotein-sorting protein
LFLRFFLFFFLLFSYSLNLIAKEKESIINRLLEINNFTFNFEQTIQGKTETGTCFLVFDNKLKCIYADKNQKEIIINKKTLVVIKKRYDKIYFYPISKSPFLKILNKNSLINLVRESNLELNNNIDLVYFDKNGKKITVFFEKKSYDLIGWEIEDKFQNEIYFTLKIKNKNTEIDNDLFKIPSKIKE